MTDPNAYNFENYGQEGTDVFGSTEGDTQYINQNISPMDPSAYYQGENNILQESAGIGNVTGNADFLNQETTTTFNADSLDTNAIFGQTLQNETQVPENYGEQTTNTTTTNVIEGNNYYDTTNQIQEPNEFISDGNIDTNTYFTNEQPIQQATTTTTETNEFYGQTQDIQPTFGETQILQGTEANTFFETNPNDFGQIQTQPIEGQDIYGTYQATRTNDLNTFGYGTSEIQQVISPQPQTKPEIVNPPPEPYFPPIDDQIVQTQTTTTTTTVNEPNMGMQFNNQNLGPLDYEAYPASTAPTHKNPPKPQYDITQFQQTLDATPLTTSTTIDQFSPQAQQPITIQQAIPSPAPKVIATPQPIVQATYTPPPKKVTLPVPRPIAKAPTQVRYVKRTVPRTIPQPVPVTTITPPPVTVAPQPQTVQQTYQVQTANPPVPVVPQPQTVQQTYQVQTANPLVPFVQQQQIIQPTYQNQVITQPGQLAGYQYINKLIDEDFRRGRPLYNEPGVPSTKLKIPKTNQLNQINATPTYKVGNIVGLHRNKIGLSRLGHSNSYTNIGINTPTINNIVPNVNTPNINLPNINTPNLNMPEIKAPNINIPNINTPNINTNLGNVINDNIRNVNTPNINTNIGNTINDNIKNINTNIGNNINNVIGNVNSGLDKLGKASSYNVGSNSITPLLNNVGLNANNEITTNNNKLPQLKDFI